MESKMSSDLGSSFDSLKNSMFVFHRGCVLEKVSLSYLLFRIKYNSLQEVDIELDTRLNSLNNSIKKATK